MLLLDTLTAVKMALVLEIFWIAFVMNSVTTLTTAVVMLLTFVLLVMFNIIILFCCSNNHSHFFILTNVWKILYTEAPLGKKYKN